MWGAFCCLRTFSFLFFSPFFAYWIEWVFRSRLLTRVIFLTLHRSRPGLLRGALVWHLKMVPITPIRMVCRLTLWHCCARACFNLICCSDALASCCSGCVSSQYLTSMRFASQCKGYLACVSLWWPFFVPTGSMQIASGLEQDRSSSAEGFGRSHWGKVLLAPCAGKARLTGAIRVSLPIPVIPGWWAWPLPAHSRPSLRRPGKTRLWHVQHKPWIQKLDTDLWNKVTFDVHPTNPQADLQPIGSCEFWIRNVDLVRCKPRPTNEQPSLSAYPPPLILPEIYSSRVACIYSTDGKCQGMMAPERLNILHTAFHTAKLKRLHNNITPAPKSFASELLGLLTRNTKLERKYHGKKIKDSFLRTLPNHVHTALQKWALVTQ